MSDIVPKAPVQVDAAATRVTAVRLVRCEFEAYQQAVDALRQYQVGVEYRIAREYPAPNVLKVVTGLAVFRETEDRPFRLVVDYLGRFETDEEHIPALQAFAKYNAVALLIPYLREAASSLSVRAGLPPFILAPVNVQQLVDTIDAAARPAVAPEPR